MEKMINKRNPSLLAKVYGLFDFKLQGQEKIYFMLMKNAINLEDKDNTITHAIDIKGSIIHRRVLPNKSYLTQE